MKKHIIRDLCILTQVFLLCLSASSSHAASPGDVVINEIAWRTGAGAGYIWIELYNNTDGDINLTNWVIRRERDGKEVIFADDPAAPGVNLNNSTITSGGYFIIERIAAAGDSPSIADITGDFQSSEFWNYLQMAGEHLILKDCQNNIIDEVDCSGGWFAGDNDFSMSMERILPEGESNSPLNWATYDPDLEAPFAEDNDGNPILGTPGTQNSVHGLAFDPPDRPEKALNIQDSPFFPRGDNTPEESRIAYRNTKGKTVYATLTVFDVNGYKVRSLLRYQELLTDEWDFIIWSGEDDYGNILPMGVYVVRLELDPADGSGSTVRQAPVVVGRKF